MVVLIHGFKRSGKDTIADLIIKLAEKNNKTAVKLPLAKPIKEILAETLDMSENELEYVKERPIELRYVYEDTPVVNELTGRDLLKNFGQTMKEYLGKTIWSDIILHKIFLNDSDIYIIPDVRFYEEEFQYLMNRLVRDFHDVVTLKVKGGIKDKGFEKEIPDTEFDIVLDNTQKDPNMLKEFEKILEEEIIKKSWHLSHFML